MKVRWELLALAVVLALYFAFKPATSEGTTYKIEDVQRMFNLGISIGASEMYAICKPKEI